MKKPNEKLTAIVHFRVRSDGAYRWLKGMRRGWWRVLLVRDPKGSMSVNSNNVVEAYNTSEGILGVTEKSKYYLGYCKEKCEEAADHYNLHGRWPWGEKSAAE